MTGEAVNAQAIAAKVDAAREVIRSPDFKTRRVLLDACDVLLSFGSTDDVLTARELQRSILVFEEQLARIAGGHAVDERPRFITVKAGRGVEWPSAPARSVPFATPYGRGSERRWPSGWWLLPSVVFGVILIAFALRAF